MIHRFGRPIEGSAVHQDSSIRRRVTTRMGHVALFVALAVVPVLALNSLATADTGTDPRPGPTDAQRACLSGQGVTLPTPGSPSERPALTQQERKDLGRSAKACGLRGPHRTLRQLTDEQRQCLADLGVTPPTRPTDGTRPQVTAEQRDALWGAAVACGLPARGHHDRGGSDGRI